MFYCWLLSTRKKINIYILLLPLVICLNILLLPACYYSCYIFTYFYLLCLALTIIVSYLTVLVLLYIFFYIFFYRITKRSFFFCYCKSPKLGIFPILVLFCSLRSVVLYSNSIYSTDREVATMHTFLYPSSATYPGNRECPNTYIAMYITHHSPLH